MGASAKQRAKPRGIMRNRVPTTVLPLPHVSLPCPASPFSFTGWLQHLTVREGGELQQEKGQNQRNNKDLFKNYRILLDKTCSYVVSLLLLPLPPPIPIKQQITVIKEKKVKRNLKGCEKPLITGIVA